jgi:hypothetical protein
MPPTGEPCLRRLHARFLFPFTIRDPATTEPGEWQMPSWKADEGVWEACENVPDECRDNALDCASADLCQSQVEGSLRRCFYFRLRDQVCRWLLDRTSATMDDGRRYSL